jgi:hypothetical protein
MLTKKDLTALKKDISAIDKKLEKLLQAVSTSKNAGAAKPAKRAPVEAAKKRAGQATATDQVLAIINRSKKGVDTATLMNKTGFNQKKVTNILHRSFKAGKIKRVEKGIYLGAK